jgi:hypothetical protein
VRQRYNAAPTQDLPVVLRDRESGEPGGAGERIGGTRREVARAAPFDQDARTGFRFSRAFRLAARVFWIAVFVAVFLLFSGALSRD